ncbi:MAG: hypothetical protein P4L92_03190, partial [Rudaea sp.]|nr:hypothetical protein [Rudaea sp.]
IQTQKSYLFLHDRFLSACGSELCFLLESQPNPRSAHWTGHSILTKALIHFVAFMYGLKPVPFKIATGEEFH